MKTPDLQPVLTGSTVIVRPVTEADWPAMFAAAADAEIWAGHPAQDRYTKSVFREFFEEALASGSAFAIIDRDSNTIIGSSRYHGYDAIAGEIEIGWTFLARDYWGGDVNREVKQLMLDHAFSLVKTVIFWIGKDNIRSQRATIKIGAVKSDAALHPTPDNKAASNFVYEITKQAFLKR